MRPAHLVRRFLAVLVACLAPGLPCALQAQQIAVLSNATTQVTNPASTDVEGVRPELPSSFPRDPSLDPFLALEQPPEPTDARLSSKITTRALQRARRIADPAERAFALNNLARGAILSNQTRLAHRALEEASASALTVQEPLIHDQELLALITTSGLLTEALIREGKAEPSLLEPEEVQPAPLPQKQESSTLIRLARLEWRRAAFLARAIINRTYRSEYTQRVTDSMSIGSSTIAKEYSKSPEIEGAQKTPAEKPETFQSQADSILVEATELANQIERPIWKNYALVRLTVNAAESKQDKRAVTIARSITNAEARAQAFLLTAESQSRNNQAEAATRSYAEVAQAVASVPQDGLRGVLAGLLVDSLIATGRFEDARACVTLYPTESKRLVALGAIAESQGRRGAAETALEWIAREVPPAHQSALYRRVSNGVLEAIERNRSREFFGREFSTPR